MPVTNHGEQTIALMLKCEFGFFWNVWVRMTGWHVYLAHECLSQCLMCNCVIFFFPHSNTVCVSRCNLLTLQGQRAEGKPERCVCAEQYWSIHTHKGCVSASSVMGSGRWSTGAQCRATWSVGSAWLECHQSEPLGLQNQAPKLSLRHTPPENTHAHKNLDMLQYYRSLLRCFWRRQRWAQVGWMQE